MGNRSRKRSRSHRKLVEQISVSRLRRLLQSEGTPQDTTEVLEERKAKPWWLGPSKVPKCEEQSEPLHQEELNHEEIASEYQEVVKPVAVPQQLVEAVIALNVELVEYLRKSPQAVHGLSPRQFEELIAEILASYGYSVQLTRATKDGGYDIFAINRDALGLESAWLVECKKYNPSRPVGVEIVRSFWAVKTDLRVPNGLIATTSSFTRGALSFKSSRYDMALKDLAAIIEWVNAYRPHPDGRLYLRDNRLLIGDRRGVSQAGCIKP